MNIDVSRPQVFVLAGLLALSCGRAVADGDYLGEQALRETIVGHSLQGDGWIEFYASDGTIHGKARLFGVRSYTGRWTISADRVCYDYDGSTYDTCSKLKLQNDKVYHYALNGSLKNDGVASRAPGNQLSSF